MAEIYRGAHVFGIKGDIITISNGGKTVPEVEWEHTASFHKLYLDQIIAGLKALQQNLNKNINKGGQKCRK